jgi:outer membrane receptor protein involved in Fe transport
LIAELRRAGRAGRAFGLLAAMLCIARPGAALEPADAGPSGQVQVTATRIAEPVAQVPADITVIHGEELRQRGATDLASALSLVAGVEAPPGGDAGPASAVPSFWGLHEFDAFLLVVDGVPWGGAFNPAISTLNLNDVERIEVMKGSAPVVFGATSFVGVIHVIHYPAGAAAQEARIGYGSFGSARASVSTALPSAAAARQSISLDAQKTGFSDARESLRGGNALYRGAMPLGGGEVSVDLGLGLQRQAPPSPTVREGGALTTRTPLDANFNPADSRIDEVRPHARLGFDLDTSIGRWGSVLAAAHSSVRDVRGFLRAALTNDGTPNSDFQDQDRSIKDLYLDTHLATALADALTLVYGTDLLFGIGRQQSRNGAYFVPIDGSRQAAPVTSLTLDEVNALTDRREFLGQYAQLAWNPSRLVSVTAGLRLNETAERKQSSHVDRHDPTADLADRTSLHTTRLTGTAGLVVRAWDGESGSLGLFADYRDSVKPAAIDFGPDYTPAILNPESAQSYEAGERLELAGGKLAVNASLFEQKFQHLVLQTTDANGNPFFQNAGAERLRGAEMDVRTALRRDLQLSLGASYHDAVFTDGVATEGGANVALAGRQLTLAPHLLASLGLIWAPADGASGSVVARHIGRRYLDLANTAPAGAYTTVDVTAGYQRAAFGVDLAARNLSNRRVPVSQSEFGDASYYLLPARSLLLELRWNFRP